MSEQIGSPGKGARDGVQGIPPAPTVVQQAGQIVIDTAVVIVHRTLADEHSPYVVLRIRHDDEVVDATARPGQEIQVPGVGTMLVVDVRPSTRQLRGAVALLRR